MIDINLDPIAYMINLIIFAIGIIGLIFLWRKTKAGSILWISVVLNFFSYLYFMGNYRFHPDYFYSIINSYWPWLNLALFIVLIISFFKKNEKTK